VGCAFEPRPTRLLLWCREGELNPQGAKHRRILSSLVGSDPFGKFSTLFDFSTAYKLIVLIGSDPKCSVLSMELLQFYYSRKETIPFSRPGTSTCRLDLTPTQRPFAPSLSESLGTPALKTAGPSTFVM